MMTNPQISVVLATRNRSASLASLLSGLYAQVNAPPFEVIVGDNGSSDDTPAVVETARSRLQIKYMREDRPGKSRALNAALRLAQGKLIVFTDDDVQPYPDWLACMYAASIAYPECNIFGGRIVVDLNNVPAWVSRSYNLMGLLACKHDRGNVDCRYGYNEYPFGPNMAVRRHCLTGYNNPYPEHLGPGSVFPVGDESAFFLLFSPPEATDRLFVARSCVIHEVEEENIMFFSAAKRCYLAGRANGMQGFEVYLPHESAHVSTKSLIFARLKTCRSLRELFCITVRYLGYRHGYYEFQKKRHLKQ